jgi:hypothetical protein
MVSGLKKLSELAGPDSVIFPNLHGQPLFDLHWKNDLWDQLTTGQSTTGDTDRKPRWENFQHTPSALLTPNLPNVFLAIVPAQTAAQIARDVEAAIRSEWKTIAGEVWKFAIAPHSLANEREKRFFRQTDRHLVLSWHATPFPQNLDDAEKLASRLPDTSILERFRTMRAAFEQHMPLEHRDRRFYTGDTKTKLNNIGTAWPLLVALNAWSLDATRKTHPFPAWLDATPNASPQSAATHNTKDVLNGREEMITGGNAQNLNDDLTRDACPFFKHEGDEVGATTLIKRLWHHAYLCRHPRWKGVFDSAAFSMPNTRSIANSNPWANDSDDNLDNADPDASGGKYFAILAFDGDNIGRWVSGEKLPPLKTQLADYTENDVRKGALAYFESIPAFKPLLDGPRPLNPACHLQFSESLSNFALLAVPRIIAVHDGRLLYAGGDDVLAMLPATTVLDCADDLQRAFRGISPYKDCGIRQIAPGFLGFGKYEKSDPDRRHPITFPAIDDNNKNLIPHLVPGPRATASCGIAIAHFKSPLQDAVRAAQDAEKRAKKFYPAKHAFAISVFKRSGEITQWAARFENDHALDAIRWITHAIDDEILSSKFPHKLLQLTAPYHSAKATHDIPGLDIREVIRHDLDLAMERQRGAKWPGADDEPGRIRESLAAYLHSLPSQSGATAMIQSLEGLLIVTAFLCRQ